MKISSHIVPIRFTINGKSVEVEVGPGETALHTIRERLGLKGTKEGCSIGECGACTIVVDGMAVNSCIMLAPQLNGREVLTVEGLGDSSELNSVQNAFLGHHAVQCGFCTPGLMMSTHALLKENPNPDHNEIVDSISGNLCRCTGYTHIVSAIEDATNRFSEDKT